MNNKIFFGSIIAVVLLLLVSFSSVVGYSSVKSNPSNTIITDESDSYTPIQLVFQLIAKLRNHKDIESVETEDDVLRIIEGDEELNSIMDKLSAYDRGCEDDSRLEWNFPIACMLLLPLYIITFGILVFTGIGLLQLILAVFGYQMNCFWAPDV